MNLTIKTAEGEELTLIPYVVCPLCGLSRKAHKNGRYALIRKKQGIESRAVKYNPEKETRFDVVNFFEEPFISLRVRAFGRGGLPEAFGLTMEEALKSDNEEIRRMARDLLAQIKFHTEELLNHVNKLLGE